MIYLDHAATSFPKPAPVLAAVQRWFAEQGVSAGRGDSRLCAEVGGEVRFARERIAALVGVPAARVAFTSGATESLNLFLRGFLDHGDAVLTTAIEHSSLVRPLVALRDTLGLSLEIVPCDAHGRIATEHFAEALRRRRFRLLAFSHASNVTGAVLDARAIVALARAQDVTTLVDASQSAGLLPLDLGADATVASVHKHLHAPPALGFLAAREGLELRQGKQGGTGSSRALERHPDAWPSAFEAGTPNTPAIVGLAAALRWLEGKEEQIRAHGLELVDALAAALARATPQAIVHSPPASERDRVPILSFTLPHLDPSEAGAVLADAGIHVRTGYHCAPWIHRWLGTEGGGTIRVSPGPHVSEAEILATARVLAS